MLDNNYKFISEFERIIADYTGFKYCVATDSCTNALFLALYNHNIHSVDIPKHTYISVPFMLQQLGIDFNFVDKYWKGYYEIGKTNIFDCAVYLKRDMAKEFKPQSICCLSFGEKKGVKIGKGGAILFNNPTLYDYFQRLSYDGRDYTKILKDDDITSSGFHMKMTPSDAGRGIHNFNLNICKEFINGIWKDYENISKYKVF